MDQRFLIDLESNVLLGIGLLCFGPVQLSIESPIPIFGCRYFSTCAID